METSDNFIHLLKRQNLYGKILGKNEFSIHSPHKRFVSLQLFGMHLGTLKFECSPRTPVVQPVRCKGYFRWGETLKIRQNGLNLLKSSLKNRWPFCGRFKNNPTKFQSRVSVSFFFGKASVLKFGPNLGLGGLQSRLHLWP